MPGATKDSGADHLASDLFDEWSRLRRLHGPRTTLVDLYRMVAEPRGMQPHELPASERADLSRRALAVMYDGFELTSDSDRGSEPVEILPYDAGWPARFQRWHARLATALHDGAVRIEHVGSTSVPGLPAKPVIDIQVSVPDLTDEPRYVPPLADLGLQLRSRDADHRYFRPFPGRPRDVQVHVCRAGGRWERDHLVFRDYLRATPSARDAYAAVKADAANVWRDDRMAYTEAKSEVILEIMAKADAWAVGWSVAEADGPSGN